MLKAKSKGCQRKKGNKQEHGKNQQQLDTDSEEREGDQESCGTLDQTKNALV